MGLYIEGMEMPKKPAIFCIHPTGTVYSEGEKYTAIFVPPHGRLIDADAVERNLLKMQQAQTGPCSHGVRKSRAVLRDAPTIIEAEEGE